MEQSASNDKKYVQFDENHLPASPACGQMIHACFNQGYAKVQSIVLPCSPGQGCRRQWDAIDSLCIADCL
jgi:hypothetical protein